MATTNKSITLKKQDDVLSHFRPGSRICSPFPKVLETSCSEQVDNIVDRNLLPLNFAADLYQKSQFSKFVLEVSAIFNQIIAQPIQPVKRLLNLWDIPASEKSSLAEYGLPGDEAQFGKDVAALTEQHKGRILFGYWDMFWSYFFAADGEAAIKFNEDPLGTSKRFLEIAKNDIDEGRKNIIREHVLMAIQASGEKDPIKATAELLTRGLRFYAQYSTSTMDSAHYFHAFAERGLRTTSALSHMLYPQLFLDDKSNSVFFPQKIRRVLIIGPGLEFSNEELGTKVPRQMYEPFAVIEGLVKNGYAQLDTLSVDLVDVNPDVIEHAQSLVDAAQKGLPYKLVLSIDPAAEGHSDLKAFFDRFGTGLQGANKEPTQRTSNGALWRTLSIPPDIVAKMHPIEADITTQAFSPAGEYDLILCFNTMIYFNNKERFLAGINIARALNSNGSFVTDNVFVKDTGVRPDNPKGSGAKEADLFHHEFPLRLAGFKIPKASDNTINPMIVYRKSANPAM